MGSSSWFADSLTETTYSIFDNDKMEIVGYIAMVGVDAPVSLRVSLLSERIIYPKVQDALKQIADVDEFDIPDTLFEIIYEEQASS